MKKNIEAKENIELKENVPNEIKVIFKNTYIGDLGIYYKGGNYILPFELYKKFKNDCKEVK
jgi:hypothetical protein